jgi:hypothetical protein
MKSQQNKSQIAKLLDRHKFIMSGEFSRKTGSCVYHPKQVREISADRAQYSRTAKTVPASVNDQTQLLLKLL